MTEETIQQTRKEKWLKFYTSNELVFGIVIGLVLAFGFAFTPVWPLAIIAAIISGLFVKKMWHGCVIGLGSVGIAWSAYVLIAITTTRVSILMDQLGQVIIGVSNSGWLLVLIVVIVGFILGALGGSLGSGIRNIIDIQRNNNKSE
jgi:hypothetical protein